MTVAAIRVAVLGPVLLAGRDGELVEVTGTLAKRFVAALALAGGSTVGVDPLTDALWEDDPPRNPRAALQTLVSRLRQGTAEGVILSSASGYAIAADSTDLLLVRRAAQAIASDGDPDQRIRACDAALALWRGEPGDDLGGGELAGELATTAASLGSALLRSRAIALVDAHRPADALADLAVLLTQHPFDEILHELRLRALVAAGRRAEALAAFAALRETLRDELGSEPGARLVELHARILREEGAPRTTRVGVRFATTELIGRDEDVAALLHSVATTRLTTILGAGGLGKTRLAQEVARSAEIPRVVLVELAGLRSADDLPLAVASALGIVESRIGNRAVDNAVIRISVRERVLSALAERATLLVLDNCEHLIDGVAVWVDDALRSVDGLRVLTTSRSPLALAGERVYPLEPLHADGGDGPAVRLFVERATAVRPAVSLPGPTIVRICERLDGLPLAIELAAARVRTMSVDEIERRLDHRFALLAGGDRTAPERHRTLLAVIEWSWDLLTEPERRVMRRLSRFPDGFSSDGAAAVAGSGTEVLDELEALVQQSLLQTTELPRTGRVRYRMLETVAEFGELQIAEAGEDELVTRALIDWAVDFSVMQVDAMRTNELVRGVLLVDEEQDNLIAVLRAAIRDGDAETAYAVFGALGQFWTIRGAHSEVLQMAPGLTRMPLAFVPTPRTVVATVSALVVGGVTLLVDPRLSALRLLVRLRRITECTGPLDRSLAALVRLALLAPHAPELAAELERQSRDGDPAVETFALLALAQFNENRAQTDEATRLARRAFDRATSVGSLWGRSMAAQALAHLHSQRRRPALALEWAAISGDGMRAIGATNELGQISWISGLAHLSLGDVAAAKAELEPLTSGDDSGTDFADLRMVGWAGLAEIAAAEGDPRLSLELFRRVLGRGSGRESRIPGPWGLMVGSACLSMAALAGSDVWDDAEIVWLGWAARRLRVGGIVELRTQGETSDLPAIGAVLVGWAGWRMLSGGDPRDIADTLALARRLGARQDLPSVDLDRFDALARRRGGEDIIREAHERLATLSEDEVTSRALELLSAARG
ncbi:ATP-binding protein [Amnibacterium flavum]|uniref:Bacterial transcriptional activator domain-containing protein n=1 Tax=Amnibacterium flavum TaxID=2173173 RepID=A0A2V1HR40_9MICO|nr:BTAD domain-containing putative transcriptional regulator [Amnibacterium flavum]PVZ93440.1 hypothetical protein DDQ50_15865 [Amnibacterium flavum]